MAREQRIFAGRNKKQLTNSTHICKKGMGGSRTYRIMHSSTHFPADICTNIFTIARKVHIREEMRKTTL